MSYTGWALTGYIAFLAVAAIYFRLVAPPRTMQEFFVAGRQVGSVGTALTMFATLFSAFAVIGMPGFFYTHGIGSWAFIVFAEILYPFLAIFFGIRLMRLIRRSGQSATVVSPIEAIATAYRSRTFLVLTVVITIVFVLPYFALQIAGMGKLLPVLTDGAMSYWTGAAVMLLAMLLYSEAGGLKADILTDMFQGVVMLVLLTIVGFGFLSMRWDLSLAAFFDEVRASGGEALLSIPGPVGYFTRPVLISYIVLFLLTAISQPQVVVRLMAARSERALILTMVLFPILTLAIFMPAGIIGLGGAAEFDLASGDLVLPSLIREYFHPFVGALLALCVAAAAMSTTDSVLLVLGSVFARDIYVPLFDPQADNERQLMVGRWFMRLMLLGGFFVAAKPPDLIAKLSILSISGTGILAPAFAAAVFFGFRNGKVASASLIAGVVGLALVQTIIPRGFFWGLDPGLGGVAVATVTLIVGGVIYGRDSYTLKGRP